MTPFFLIILLLALMGVLVWTGALSVIVISFIAFTLFAGGLTYFLTRKADSSSSDGFFLGGRSLTFPLIAGSLLLTNLSTEQMVGLNGAAFKDGLCVMAWEVVAVITLVLMAVFFLPKFLRTGITTVPQFLRLRYNETTETIANFVFLLAYACLLLPIILYSGAQGLSNMVDMEGLTGISKDQTLFDIPLTLWLTVFFIGGMGMLYSRLGGLKTLATLDTINGIGLLIGGLMIFWFAMQAVSNDGGILAGWSELNRAQPDKMSSIGTDETSVPFHTIITGVLLLNLFYWCTNQQIIQRTFGASSLAEGQKGVLLTGALKLLGPIYLVIPGIIAYHLYANEGVRPDQAYGKLVFDLLPKPLTGFFAAVMVGAILSSFNAALNSTSALFSMGPYRKFINPKGSEEDGVKAAKWFVTIIAILAMFGAPFLNGQDTIFEYLQKMNGIYFIPIFAIVLVGMLHKRVPSQAANIALVLGLFVLILDLIVLPLCKLPTLSEGVFKLHDHDFLGLVFVVLVAFMIAYTFFAPRAKAWELITQTPINMEPWRGAKLASLFLVITVIGIYLCFAKLG